MVVLQLIYRPTGAKMYKMACLFLLPLLVHELMRMKAGRWRLPPGEGEKTGEKEGGDDDERQPGNGPAPVFEREERRLESRPQFAAI